MANRATALKWAAIPLGLVALYAALGFLLLPKLLSRAVTSYAHDTLKRDAHLGAVSVNPFTLDVTAGDFTLNDADGTPMAHFDRLHVRASLLSSIARRGATLTAVELDGLKAKAVRHADGTVNLVEIIPPSKDKNAPLPRAYVDAFTLTGAELAVRDEARHEPLELVFRPVSFELRNFSTLGEANQYGFKAETPRGESIEWHGTFALAPVKSAGHFALDRVVAATISQVGLDLLPLDITTGLLAVDGDYDLAAVGEQTSLRVDLKKIELRDVGLRARNETADWVTLPLVSIENTKIDLQAQTVDVARVRLERARVTAWLGPDGALNLAKLYSTKAAPAEAAPKDRIEKPWKVSVPRIELAAADVRFEDRKPRTPLALHVAPIDVTVTDLRIPLAGKLGLEASATINDHARLHVTGPVAVAPVDASLKVKLRDFGLPLLQPYVDGMTLLSVDKGTVNATLDVDYGAHVGPAASALPLKVRGEVEVHGLRTKDKPLGEDFINWRLLALRGIEMQGDPLSVAVNEVVVTEPYAKVVIAENRTTNIAAVLGTKPEPATDGAALPPRAEARPAGKAPSKASSKASSKAPAKAAPPPELPYSVKLVRIEDGSMNFADFSVTPKFQSGIQGLAGAIKGISGKPGTKAQIALTGKVDRYAPVHIDGQMNVLSVESYTDIKLGFRNLELTTFSPYSGKFAGYRVEKGKMSVDFSYHIQNRQLDARHHLILDQLELGEKVDSKEATGLPVKLAIALLKDGNGVIDLDVPVNGSLDDPQFRVWPVIWKVLGNLVTKIVTSPFKLLGSLFGGGSSPEVITFQPGSAELDSGAMGQIETLKKGLAARPALKLDIPMVSCPDADSAALTDSAWSAKSRDLARAQLAAGHRGKRSQPVGDDEVDSLLADAPRYRKLLEEAYRAAHGAAPVLPPPAPDADADEAAASWLESQLKAGSAPPPTALPALARSRAEAVERGLLDGSGIDPARIFLTTDKGSDCKDPAFVPMRLALK